jgi:hypothetical protein
MKLDKKSRERLLLKEIIELSPDFQFSVITDCESPDFLVGFESRVLGVEMVDYIRSQNNGEAANRRKEIVWQKIVDAARENFEKDNNVLLIANFHWYPHKFPSQSEVTVLASYISSLISSKISLDESDRIRLGDDDFDGTPLEEYLRSIIIHRVKKQSLWNTVSADFIEVQAKEIQELLSSKSNKVGEYLVKCSSVWLIIVADGQYISSNVDLQPHTLQYSYSSRFERVFFYDRISRKVFRLKTSD